MRGDVQAKRRTGGVCAARLLLHRHFGEYELRQDSPAPYKCGEREYGCSVQPISITLSGREIRLTQTEYNIVTVLAHHAGRVMTYSSIIRAVWGTTDEGSVKKLQVNLANIRKKLGERPGDRRYISNELGVGYRMISDGE